MRIGAIAGALKVRKNAGMSWDDRPSASKMMHKRHALQLATRCLSGNQARWNYRQALSSQPPATVAAMVVDCANCG